MHREHAVNMDKDSKMNAIFTIGRINHVGVVVPDIAEAINTYRTVYGVNDITTPFDMPEQGVRVCFVNLENAQIELIEPLGADSPISKFAQNNPKGSQHHVCFEVEDIHETIKIMKDRGARILGAPRIGAHGTPIIFIHPDSTHGVLVELMETPKTGNV